MSLLYTALCTSHIILSYRPHKMAELLTTYQFVIGPVINPDGYEYTSTDRLVRFVREVGYRVEDEGGGEFKL